MQAISTYLPSYSVGQKDVYAKIPTICGPFGKTAVVIGGKTAMAKAKDDLLAGIENSEIHISDFIWFGDDANRDNIEALRANPTIQKADMIFGVGGGRALDTVKVLAELMDKPIFAFPTIASNCAPVTLVSILYHPDRSFSEFYFRTCPPNHTFINLDIIAEAPEKYIWAGIGDAMSKQYEVSLSSRGDELDHSNQMGIDLARHCSDPLLKYGAQAYEDAKTGRVSEALTQVALNIIVTTGMVSVLIETFKYNGHLAHAIYYASTTIPSCDEHHDHGEIVGYGNLPLLMMDGDMENFEKAFALNRSIGLPTSIGGIDIPIDSDDYKSFLSVCAADTANLGHSPYKVTKEMIDKAIRDVEAYNQKN